MKIIIATGGSGGHFFPALRVAQYLKNQKHQVLLMGALGMGEDILRREEIDFIRFEGKGIISGSFAERVSAILLLISAFFLSLKQFKLFHPNAVIGFGSYASFPVVSAAASRGIPTMIHEQNVVPGKANALLAKFVRKIAVSFPGSEAYFPKNKIVMTGCPSHCPQKLINRQEACRFLNLKDGKVTILVVGGSQGSHAINENFLQAVKDIRQLRDIQLIHISGRKDFSRLKSGYQQIGLDVALFEFLDKMNYAYEVSDVVVARAGAVTVSELGRFQLPAVIIPYPHARGHQRENARVLERVGLAEVIDEKDLTADGLKDAVLRRLEYSKNKIVNENYRKEFPVDDSAQKISNELVAIAR
jgi:UDP-N-acetylglucosamine--N-acetylmuramyl-(pentapeptide) pyrophosphoryl-undecaprenol N-acetylglucosamine transferase